ncbi:MAG: cell division ATPase MinD [Candidatus Woesearchaeota archaeon]|nr:cell division ATPase MinD [Candidatus Woesearchaeota archaeon]
MTRFLAIASAKGGVGKTTAAINLATAMVNFGKDVVVLDANISKPNVSMHLGTPKLNHTLHDVLKGNIHITDAAYIHPSGLRIIPGNISLAVLKEIEGHDLSNFKNILIDLIGTTDLVILDTGSGLGREVQAVLGASDEMIAITNPEITSVTDTFKTIRIAEEAGCKVIGVIVNRQSGNVAEMEVKNIEAMLGKNILGIIPEDINVQKSIAARQPLVYLYPDSRASINYKQLAAKLMGQEYVHSIQAGKNK